MDRRDFLKQVIVGGAVGTVGAGTLADCATTNTGVRNASADAPPPPVDMDAYVARLDSVMEAIGRENYFADLVTVANPGATQDPDDISRRESLTRKALRSMTLAGMWLDLNQEDRAHPAMQSRLFGSLAEMDESIWGMHDMLTSMPEEHRQAVRQRLRSEPDLMDRLTDALDAKSGTIQIPAKRRMHLRRLMGQVGWRLREQDPSVFIDDVSDKIQRIAQRGAQTAPQDPNVTTMQPVQVDPNAPPPQPGVIYVQQQPPPPGVVYVNQPPPPGTVYVQQPPPPGMVYGQQPPPGTVYGQPPPPQMMYLPPPRPRRTHGPGLAIGGGAALGLGLLATGGGIAALSGPDWLLGAVLVTVGVLALVAGIVLLIIGLVRLGRSY